MDDDEDVICISPERPQLLRQDVTVGSMERLSHNYDFEKNSDIRGNDGYRERGSLFNSGKRARDDEFVVQHDNEYLGKRRRGSAQQPENSQPSSVAWNPGHFNAPRILPAQPIVQGRIHNPSEIIPRTALRFSSPQVTSSSVGNFTTERCNAGIIMLRNPLFKSQNVRSRCFSPLDSWENSGRSRVNKSPSLLEEMGNIRDLTTSMSTQDDFCRNENSLLHERICSDHEVPVRPSTTPPVPHPDVIEIEDSDNEVEVIEAASTCESAPAKNVGEQINSEAPVNPVGQIADETPALPKVPTRLETFSKDRAKISVGVQTENSDISGSSDCSSSDVDSSGREVSSETSSSCEEKGRESEMISSCHLIDELDENLVQKDLNIRGHNDLMITSATASKLETEVDPQLGDELITLFHVTRKTESENDKTGGSVDLIGNETEAVGSTEVLSPTHSSDVALVKNQTTSKDRGMEDSELQSEFANEIEDAVALQIPVCDPGTASNGNGSTDKSEPNLLVSEIGRSEKNEAKLSDVQSQVLEKSGNVASEIWYHSEANFYEDKVSESESSTKLDHIEQLRTLVSEELKPEQMKESPNPLEPESASVRTITKTRELNAKILRSLSGKVTLNFSANATTSPILAEIQAKVKGKLNLLSGPTLSVVIYEYSDATTSVRIPILEDLKPPTTCKNKKSEPAVNTDAENKAEAGHKTDTSMTICSSNGICENASSNIPVDLNKKSMCQVTPSGEPAETFTAADSSAPQMDHQELNTRCHEDEARNSDDFLSCKLVSKSDPLNPNTIDNNPHPFESSQVDCSIISVDETERHQESKRLLDFRANSPSPTGSDINLGELGSTRLHPLAKKVPPLDKFSSGISAISYEPSISKGFVSPYMRIKEALRKKSVLLQSAEAQKDHI